MGQSQDGIGIGSTRDEVINHLGNPDAGGEGPARGGIVDFYYFDDIFFSISYPDSLLMEVKLVVMGRR